MKKIFQRALSGVLSVLFVGQVLIYGDGSSQGIAHAETIADIKESLELSGNADELKQEYENASDGLGEVEYFNTSDGISLYSANTGKPSVAESCGLSISGYVGQYGTYSDLTKVKILIFDGWDLVYETTANESGFFTAYADGLGTETNVKIECDGYLPRFYKGMGWGSYWIGSPDEPEMLIPGDTTWNEEQSNQWSDEQINSADAAYVEGCIGAYIGDDNYNLSCDWDGDGTITQADLDNAKAYIEANDQLNISGLAWLDIDGSGIIDGGDIDLMYSFAGLSAEGDLSSLDFNGDGYIDYDDVQYFIDIISETDISLYNLDLYPDNILDENDISLLSSQLNLRGRSENYFEYMDKDENGTIDQSDYNWFADYGNQYAGSNPENSYKKNIKLTGYCYNPGSFNLHDANLDLNGQTLVIDDCMSFTTDNLSLWSGNEGATLDINGGYLDVWNNLVFRTASQNSGAGQNMYLNGGAVVIGGDFNFGQIGCYDTIWMTDAADYLQIWGNWNYITLTDMEGKWTAGLIEFLGPIWEVNEQSGPKSVYSSEDHVITFFYEGGKQTILWDNCETYIDNEDGSFNTERRFNFEGGINFPYGYSEDLYWFRPWWRPYDEPDYTLYRKGWEMGDGVHIATGNYTKTFTDLSVESPGVQSDFVRTYNSTSDEEGSFGIG